MYCDSMIHWGADDVREEDEGEGGGARDSGGLRLFADLFSLFRAIPAIAVAPAVAAGAGAAEAAAGAGAAAAEAAAPAM